MKDALLSYFPKAKELNQDCYVADLHKETGNKKGVMILAEPFREDYKYLDKDENGKEIEKVVNKEKIKYFHLKKRTEKESVPYLAVNLEDYENLRDGTENCEAFFASLSKCSKPWLLFLEMKYCEKADNIINYKAKTFRQMESMLEFLEELKIADRFKQRVYFTYSAPGFDEKAPFSAFLYTPAELTEILLSKKINILYYNTIIIATANILSAPV